MNEATELETCPNCGTRLTGRYCAQCGQKAAPVDPTIGHFLHELFHELLHFDGKIFRSVALLLGRPGFLTQEASAGRRASYVSPIRLYLVFSLVYFALAALAPSPVNISEQLGEAGAPVDARSLELTNQIVAALRDIGAHWVPRVMFVLVPVFAALVMVFSGRRERHYPLHLYFALHMHAVWFFAASVSALGAMAALAPISDTLGTVAALYAVGYFFLAFARVYGTLAGQTLWRGVMVGVVYALAVAAAMAALFLPTVVSLVGAAGVDP